MDLFNEYPTNPSNHMTKYVVCNCPLGQHTEVFSDLMLLSAGKHHLSVPLKRFKVWLGLRHTNHLVRFVFLMTTLLRYVDLCCMVTVINVVKARE